MIHRFKSNKYYTKKYFNRRIHNNMYLEDFFSKYWRGHTIDDAQLRHVKQLLVQTIDVLVPTLRHSRRRSPARSLEKHTTISVNTFMYVVATSIIITLIIIAVVTNNHGRTNTHRERSECVWWGISWTKTFWRTIRTNSAACYCSYGVFVHAGTNDARCRWHSVRNETFVRA